MTVRRQTSVVCLALALLGVAGCATAGGRGSRMLPWNWFSSDSTAKVQKEQARAAGADDALRREAQRMAEATKLAIAAEKERQLAAGGVSRQLATAEDYASRTASLLGASEGFLTFDVQRELANMVRLRNSALDAERARGDQLLAAADRIAGNAAEIKVKADQAAAVAQKRVAAEQQRALAAEEKYHRIWFWVWVAGAGYLLLQILPLLAHAFPSLGLAARAASWVAAPTVQAGYSRLRSAVGSVIHAAEKGGALAVDAIRSRLDGSTSEHEQRELAAHYRDAQRGS